MAPCIHIKARLLDEIRHNIFKNVNTNAKNLNNHDIRC